MNTNMIDKIKPLREHGNALDQSKSGIIHDHTRIDEISSKTAKIECPQVRPDLNWSNLLLPTTEHRFLSFTMSYIRYKHLNSNPCIF